MAIAVDVATTRTELEEEQSLPLRHDEAAKFEAQASNSFTVQRSEGCLCTSFIVIATIIFHAIIAILSDAPMNIL
jgi:hypothetical protein